MQQGGIDRCHTYAAIKAEFGTQIDPTNLANYANQGKPVYITKDNTAGNTITGQFVSGRSRGRGVQFTLAADTRKGTRPGFSTAAAPEQARVLFDHLLAAARTRHPVVASGRFGADMQVALVNDGPVTLLLDSPYHLTR